MRCAQNAIVDPVVGWAQFADQFLAQGLVSMPCPHHSAEATYGQQRLPVRREVRFGNQAERIADLQLQLVGHGDHELHNLALDLQTVLRCNFVGFLFIVLRGKNAASILHAA